MRIAVLGKKYPFCGIVTYCRELVQALREAEHEVLFCHVHDQPDYDAPQERLPAIWRTHLFVIPALEARAKLHKRLADFKPDVIHASFALGPLDWALPGICAQLNVPLIATFHVALDHRDSFPARVSQLVYQIYRSTLKHCTRVIVFSEFQRRRLLALGVPPARIMILPHGVDIGRYCPGPSTFRQQVGARQLFTYMGRLDPEKNVGTLLNSWRDIQAPPDCHLALMGDGVLARHLQHRHRGTSNVHWLGFIRDEKERIDILRGSDVFVLPSSVEGLSLALLEAMACGAVPIATDVGADGEVIEGVGLMIAPNALEKELPAALAAAIAEPDRMARYQAQVRRRIESRYSFSDNIDRLQALYQEVLRRAA